MAFNYFNPFGPFNPMMRYQPPQQFYGGAPRAVASGISLPGIEQNFRQYGRPYAPAPASSWFHRGQAYTGQVGTGAPGSLYYTADRMPHYYT